MNRPATLTIAAILLAACSNGPAASPPQPPEHALSGLSSQPVALLPTYVVTVMPGLNWSIGRTQDLKTTLDAEIAAALEEHGVKTWVLPDRLARAARANPTQDIDPYKVAEDPLRGSSFPADNRLPEPLASQVREIVAYQGNTRLVMAPVELRFEPVGTRGRGVLHVVLMDARFSTVRWSGDIASDTAAAFSPAIAATIASRLAAIVSP